MRRYLLEIFLFVLTIYFIICILPSLYSFMLELYYLLLPFIVGIILALMINPYVIKLRRKKINKIPAIFLVLVSIFYILVFIIMNLVPIITLQINNIKDNWESIMAGVKMLFDKLNSYLGFTPKLEGFSLAGITLSRYSNVFFLSPVITLYILIEYDRIIAFILKITNNNTRLRNFLLELNSHLRLFFSNMILVIGFMSMIGWILFSIIGLDYSLVLGLLIGVTNIVPFIGPYIGLFIVLLYALTISPLKALLSGLSIWGMQIIESNFLTPYLNQRRIKHSPLLIILSFVVFGKIFGIIGMILAIPLLSFITLFIKYFLFTRK